MKDTGVMRRRYEPPQAPTEPPADDPPRKPIRALTKDEIEDRYAAANAATGAGLVRLSALLGVEPMLPEALSLFPSRGQVALVQSELSARLLTAFVERVELLVGSGQTPPAA